MQLLSNGRYHVMVTNAGGGYSRWKDLAVTRWREDATRDNWGTFCYLRDVASGEFWSTAYQPTLRARRAATRRSSPKARAEFRRRDHDIETHTEIVVSPEDDIELRRLTHHQPLARRARTIEVTSYAEVVLAPPAADALHPAFSNLFVQTEIVRGAAGDPLHAPAALARRAAAVDVPPDDGARRRRRRASRTRPTARASSAAAARSPTPQRDARRAALSGSEGSVLDPIVAIRQPDHRSSPSRPATIDIVTGVAETRDACLALIEKYQDRHLADRVFDLAWTHSQVVLRQLNATEADAQLYGRLAGSVLYANAALRADAERAAAATAAGNRGCGATRSPATCRSCCCRSRTRRTSSSCASWCRRTPTGG